MSDILDQFSIRSKHDNGLSWVTDGIDSATVLHMSESDIHAWASRVIDNTLPEPRERERIIREQARTLAYPRIRYGEFFQDAEEYADYLIAEANEQISTEEDELIDYLTDFVRDARVNAGVWRVTSEYISTENGIATLDELIDVVADWENTWPGWGFSVYTFGSYDEYVAVKAEIQSLEDDEVRERLPVSFSKSSDSLYTHYLAER